MTIFGIHYSEEGKMNWERLIFRTLYLLSAKKCDLFKRRYKTAKYQNNKIILIHDGKETVLPPFAYVKGLHLEFGGNNNTVRLECPFQIYHSQICFKGDNNQVSFGKNARGVFNFILNHNNNHICLGNRVETGNFSATLHGDKLIIGNNCMFSDDIQVWTDGHSVIDAKTRKLLNPAGHTIQIGDHVWIGQGVVLLKRTNIPSNCIVAHSSVVTKAFDKENCVYAGNPAKAVKRGINWNKSSPVAYNPETANPLF